jgi:hypothetical protein
VIELTNEQQQAVDVSPEPRLIDPRTQKTYVLIGADVYDRLKGLLFEDAGPDMRQVALLVERAMAEEDAGDPNLSYYHQAYGRREA